jgi:isopentenyl-diphosphate delta-isomerase
MSELTRLRDYLAVEVDGAPGICLMLSDGALAVDLSAEIELEGSVVVRLHCSVDAPVLGSAQVLGRRDGAPPSRQRWDLRFTSFEGDGAAVLVATLSSLRKTAHLSIAANEDVEAATTRAGWDEVRLPHVALPEAHADEDIQLATELFGKGLAAPLMISGMTGGSERAGIINARLAAVAQELGLGFGLGSQRAMLENPELLPTFDVRSQAPDVLLFANVGAVQFNYGVSVDDCRQLVDSVGADALAIHLNPLQEMVQPEGDRDWRDLLRAIAGVVEGLDVPVLVKETGCGIDGKLAAALAGVGVGGIDVGGTGGTAWGWIEGFRAAAPQRKAIGDTFREWGIPTADALRSCRAELPPSVVLVATGGLRTGLDVARALALGADVGGMALPFFRAADSSAEDCLAFGRRVLEELRIAMFCAGVTDVPSLRALEVS